MNIKLAVSLPSEYAPRVVEANREIAVLKAKLEACGCKEFAK